MKTITDQNKELMAFAESLGLVGECFARGTCSANIAIVSDYPGSQEVKMRTPLVGGSGSFLWSTLNAHHLDPRQVYTTNAIKRRLETDEKKEHIRVQEKEQWRLLLQYELSLLPNLQYILIIGSYALDFLTQQVGINNWRGSVFQQHIRFGDTAREVTVLVSYNPAMVLRDPSLQAIFKFDMNRFSKVVEGKWHPTPVDAVIIEDFDDALLALDTIQKHADNGGKIAFDIEVINQETACIGFATNGSYGYCIPWRSVSDNYFTLEQEVELRQRIQNILGSTTAKLIAQNGSFDLGWLWFKDHIKVAPLWMDTLLAHHYLWPSLPHSLQFMVSYYTDHPFYKDEKYAWRENKGDPDAINRFWEYNVRDAVLTFRVAEALEKELISEKMDKTFYGHVMRLQPHLIQMQVEGVLADRAVVSQIKESLEVEVAVLLADFHKAVHAVTGDSEYYPNPSSPKQMKELCFGRLKLVGRGLSTDAENRERMRNHSKTTDDQREMLQLWDKWATENKFLSTYASLTLDSDDRVRSEWKQYGTLRAPGRLSSSSTLWGSGTNLQNQPQRAYNMFVADPGCVFIYFDMAQIEARIVAYLADIQSWKEQFEKARLNPGSYDAHRELAAQMFKVPYDEVPEEDHDEHGKPTIRFVSKRSRHGLNYRMQSDQLSTATGLPLAYCQRVHSIYHRLHPELKRWWSDTEGRVKTDRMLYTPYGRRWVLLQPYDDQITSSIIAFKPQSTNGDHVSGAIYLSHDDPEWPKGKARICINVHDALIAVAKNEPDVIRATVRVLKRHAERPIMINGERLIVPADFKISVPDEHGVHRWSTLKKLKYPQLRELIGADDDR